MDYDHSVDSDTIQISAYITPTIGSEGTDVSTGLLKFFCIISTLDTGIITQQSLLNLSFKTIKKEKTPVPCFQEAVSFTATMAQSGSANAIGSVSGDSFFSWQNSLVTLSCN